MKRKKTASKLICVLLSLIMLFYVIPSTVFAEIADGLDSVAEGEAAADSSLLYEVEKSTFEVKPLREESVKVFRLEDGSYVSAVYPESVHYMDESGAWQDVNNLLKSTLSYNESADGRVKFSKKITGNREIFTLKEGNTKLTLALEGAKKKTKGEIASNGVQESETDVLGKMTSLENLYSSIIYKEILDGVDVEYVLVGRRIKENLIVKQKAESYEYTFTLSLNNLTPHLSEDGSVYVTDADGSTKYVMPAPVVYDADGTYAEAGVASFSLSDMQNGKYSLTLRVNSEWMNSEERAFPVTVDPAIEPPSGSIQDTHINSLSYTERNGSDTEMIISAYHTGYIKINNIPTLLAHAKINSAQLIVHARGDSYSNPSFINVYPVVSNWIPPRFTYNDFQVNGMGSTSSNLLCREEVSCEGYYYLDITEQAKKWITGEEANYGVAISSGSINYVYIRSSEYSNTAMRPSFTVSYTPISGIEDYWSYYSHSVGAAGTGSINYATGDLNYIIPLLSTTDSLIPYTPTLVYSSTRAGAAYINPSVQTAYTSSYTPNGFKLNINETVINASFAGLSGEDLYIWADGDGTEHYMYPVSNLTGVYADIDGLQMTLTVSDSELVIEDRRKTKRIFSKMESDSARWYLTEIRDVVGNAVVFGFDSAYRPTSVGIKPKGISVIPMLTLAYNDSSMPYYVYNINTCEGIVFAYSDTATGAVSTAAASGKYLREIIYVKCTEAAGAQSLVNYTAGASGVTELARASYTYDTEGKIIAVKDNLKNYSVNYEYTDHEYTDDQVTKITELGGTVIGQSVGFEYGTDLTKLTSSGSDDAYGTADDITTTFAIDKDGRVVSYYTLDSKGKILGAGYGVYETQENVKNNLKETAVVGGGSMNHLVNGDFESGGTYWEKSSNVYIDYPDYDDEHYSMRFDVQATQSVEYIRQKVSLSPGTYTLSALIRATECTGVTVRLVAEANGSAEVESVSVDEDLLTTEGYIASLNITVSGEESKEYYIRVEVIGGATVASTATVTVDNVTLVSGIGVGKTNLVEAADFESKTINGAAVPQNTFWSVGFSAATDTTFGTVAALSGNISSQKYVKQNIYTIPSQILGIYNDEYVPYNSGETYIVSGFGKAADALRGGGSTFGLKVVVTYYHGNISADTTEEFYFGFSSSCEDWQYVSGSFTTDVNYCVKSIDVYCDYSYQEGTAYFDGISVEKSTDKNVVKYSYYLNGLLKNMQTFSYEESYEYDTEGRIIRTANNRGELVSYKYNLMGLVSSEVYYTFTNGASLSYPALPDSDNPSETLPSPTSQITATPYLKTEYIYYSYGLLAKTDTYEVTISESSGTTFDTMWVVAKSGTKHITTYATYNLSESPKIFGSLKIQTDEAGNRVQYFYDSETLRLVATVNLDSKKGTSYQYDDLGNVTKTLPATVSTTDSRGFSELLTSGSVEYVYDERNMLTGITTGSTDFTVAYDPFGNMSEVSANERQLAEYEYNANNGKLVKTTYGNGDFVRYVYDSLENVKEIWYNNTKAYEYTYTSDGQVHKIENLIDGTATLYKYDTNNRVVSVLEYTVEDMYNDLEISLGYDKESRVDSMQQSLRYSSGNKVRQARLQYVYSYDQNDGKIISTIITGSVYASINYTYDAFDRLTAKSYGGISNSFTYVNVDDNTTHLVSTHTVTINGSTETVTYTYDEDGNITNVTYSSGKQIRYEYDSLGQLTREDNQLTGKSYLYTYDSAGNILTKSTAAYTTAETVTPTETKYYAYDDADLGDLLTSYDGVSFTYDEIGNPLYYYNGAGYNFTWNNRTLVSATKGGVNMSFTYDSDGMRQTKTVGNETTKYYYYGTLLLAMENTSGETYVFIYDESGSPIGFQYRTTSYAVGAFDTYWYKKSLQGDITAVYSSSKTLLVSYTYDAWGNFTTQEHNGASTTAAVKNPLRYRGYFYDDDLDLYYLASRYYDAKLGRFISPDSYLSTGQGILGHNMYAYCNNNPVNMVDCEGDFPILILANRTLSKLFAFFIADKYSPEVLEAKAKAKYNENTVSINGNIKDAAIKVEITNDGKGFEIKDSYNIHSEYEKRAILETILASEYYTSDYKDIDAMIIEWSGHNFGYRLSNSKLTNDLFYTVLKKKDANNRFKSVNIQGLDDDQWIYEIVTKGGRIQW